MLNLRKTSPGKFLNAGSKGLMNEDLEMSEPQAKKKQGNGANKQ
jgi:hypothetical protein